MKNGDKSMNAEDRKARERAYQRAYHQRPDVRARLIKRRYADRERRSQDVESFNELSRGDHSADQRNPRAHVRAHETEIEEVPR